MERPSAVTGLLAGFLHEKVPARLSCTSAASKASDTALPRPPAA